MYSLFRSGSGPGTRGSALGRSVVGAIVAVPILVALVAPADAPTSRAAEPRVPSAEPRALRVCADPNNLPFSNERLEGIENRLAALAASEMGARVEYTWWPQRRGFFRHTLNAGACDVVFGVPAGLDFALTTRPVYRSTYVFVYRSAAGLRVRSFDDPALRTARVGVQLVGDDGANTPPAHALAHRGIVRNVVGYTLYGDYSTPNPPARIIEAVANGEIDIAVAWGPMAGYFAARQRIPLDVVPVPTARDASGLWFAYDIAVGVRKGDRALRDTMQAIIDRRRSDIDRILDDYDVPRLPPQPRPSP